MVMVSGSFAPQQPVNFFEVRWLQWPSLEVGLSWSCLPNLVYVDLRNTEITHLDGIEVMAI